MPEESLQKQIEANIKPTEIVQWSDQPRPE
jgi:hypothetical protein